MQKNCKIIGGVRFIDDIELSFARLADADQALKLLESSLHEIELQLNSSKTTICDLPASFESIFVSELRSRIPRSLTTSRSQWVDFFNKAFLLARTHPDDGVLRYAIASLQEVKIHASTWPIAQALLWQCIALDPGCLRFVINILWRNAIYRYRPHALRLDLDVAAHALNDLVLESAPVGHGGEVVWSIWASMIFDLNLSPEAWNAITQVDDAFVAVAAYALAAHNPAAVATLHSPLWESWLVNDCFTQSHWLFAYEAFRHGWLTAALANTNIAANPVAAFLKQHSVSFFDLRAVLPYRKRQVPPIGSLAGY